MWPPFTVSGSPVMKDAESDARNDTTPAISSGTVSLSYVDDVRDGRGRAFRETTEFGAFGLGTRGPRPSFVNDAPWRISVEPVSADWAAPHRREALAG